MDQKVKELLLNEAENHKDRLVSLVSKLTQFDSYIGDEREIAHFVKDELNNIGLDVRTTDVDHDLIKKEKNISLCLKIHHMKIDQMFMEL